MVKNGRLKQVIRPALPVCADADLSERAPHRSTLTPLVFNQCLTREAQQRSPFLVMVVVRVPASPPFSPGLKPSQQRAPSSQKAEQVVADGLFYPAAS